MKDSVNKMIGDNMNKSLALLEKLESKRVNERRKELLKELEQVINFKINSEFI